MHRCNARTRSAADLAPAEPGEWAGEGYCKRSAGWGTEHKGEGRCKSHGGNATAPTGGAPAGNKNAVTTGEHETFFAGSLSAEEQALWAGVDPDPLAQIDEQIRYCVLRLRRMQQRADRLRGEEFGMVEIVTEEGERPEGPVAVTKEARQSNVERIQAIQDAITRVQGRHTRLIKLRHRVADTDEDNEELDELIERLDGVAKGDSHYEGPEVG